MGFDEMKALRFEENARLARFKECRSTSKSKQGVFPGFSTKKYTGRIGQKPTKDYFKVGSSTLLDKNL